MSVVAFEELKAQQSVPDVVAVPDEPVEEEDGYTEWDQAVALIKKAAVMLDYMSDPDLCKSVDRRERDAMFRFSEQLWEFVEEAEVYDVEVEEDEVEEEEAD
jgi:hypothetical protein